MSTSIPKHIGRSTAAIVLLAVVCPLSAEVQENDGQSPEVRQLVEQLGSRSFKTRADATKKLASMGASVVAPLKAALPTAGPAKRDRIEKLLTRLERDTFSGRLVELIDRPTLQTAELMPQWARFAEIVGRDSQSITFFARLLKAEEELFAIAANDADNPKNLQNQVSQRAVDFFKSSQIRSSKVSFSNDSFAALLLLASDEKIRLAGATSFHITDTLVDNFAGSLRTDDGPMYRKLIGAWILRKRINSAGPLLFATRHPMPEGLILARRTLRDTLRRPQAMNAMSLILKQGDVNDIALLESLFDPQNPDYNAKSGRKVIFEDKSGGYSCCFGDWAMAVAISMRDKHPFEFGFTSDKGNVPPRIFAFTEGSTGFANEEDREAAIAKYRASFLSTANTSK